MPNHGILRNKLTCKCSYNHVPHARATYMYIVHMPHPRKRGPMGGAPYIGLRLGNGPIFEISISYLYAKERPGNLPTL